MTTKRSSLAAAASVGAALILGLTACGGGGTGAAPGGTFNAGLTKVVNPSSHNGGTLVYVVKADFDSTDPGNTYYGWSWDFVSNYARTLLTYTPQGNLAPDLATSLGQRSSNGLTWTYHLKPDLKLEDGEVITAQMIKYAIERTACFAGPGKSAAVLPLGPVYWCQFLTDPSYPGAFYDKTPGKLGYSGISTPNATTIVFHLRRPMAEFDNLVAMSQTAPVPEQKDTGANYLRHPLSSGPYMFGGDYVPGKGLTLVKNPMWNAASDPVRKQLVDQIKVTVNVPPTDVDNELIAGQADLDLFGTGVVPSDQARVLTNQRLKNNTDDIPTGFLRYAAISTKVPPFNNVHCRMAVLYATDHVQMQTSFGGSYGGDIATQAIPPNDSGYIPGFDPYGFGAHPHGDLTAARQQLAMCGQRSGFKTTITARSDDPKETAAAVDLQAMLSKIGITADIYKYPSADIGSVVGTPDFVHKHGLGIMMYEWGADWKSGYGFFEAIANGSAITTSGNSNLPELNDPTINQALDTVMANNDPAGRAHVYQQINRQLMQDAVMLPFVNEKALTYRNPRLSNVMYNPARLLYDYTQIGIK